MLYLSAAVSDYYLSNNERPEHKIQTKSKIIHQNNDGDNNNNNNDKSIQAVENLNLTLKPVPKLMKLINTLWAPNSYVISFKLETDNEQLLIKAQKSLQVNHSNIVVANLLHTRTKEVWLVHKQNDKESITIDHINIQQLVDKQSRYSTSSSSPSSSPGDIESVLIPRLIELHEQYILQRQ
uniref:DFP domain-containing protein n=1 Tax=Trichobilharzia regenti TaxID=157069 RepID=A0AA85KBS8_TRIRE|nr:unnamed protein product [Trichobilharzia regenti]